MKKINLHSSHLSRIALDFSEQGKRVPIIAISLVMFGLILVVIALASYFDSTHQLAVLSGTRSSQYETTDIKLDSKISPSEIEAIQKSLNQLAIPWGTLFSAMEASSSDKVVLISLEPNADKRSVRIIAEATDVYEMLDYIRKLSAQPQIYKIYLVNQKAGEDQQEAGVRFTLEGYWARP